MGSSAGQSGSVRVVPRVVGAATVTLVGGVVFVNGQPAAAATFTVTNLNDAGAGSLRDAIDQANAMSGADTIEFDPTVFDPGSPVTIALTTGRLLVDDDLTIVGPGEGALTLTNATGDVIYVGGYSLTLSGVTIDGAGDNAISANNALDIELQSVTITDSVNDAIELFDTRSLEVIDSVISGSGDDGIDAYDITSLYLQGTQVIGNGSHGIELDRSGYIDVIDTVVSENSQAGLYAELVNGPTSIEGSTFSDNGSEGLYLRSTYSSVTIRDSDFERNGGTGAYLRYISGSESDVVVTDSRFIDNDNEGFEVYSVDGGVRISGVEVSGSSEVGIYLTDVEGDIVIESSLVTDNELGVYVRNASGMVTLSDVTILDSASTNLLMYRVDGDVLIERVTSAGAIAGPGVGFLASQATIRNSTVSGNAGGGVTVVNSEVSIEHSTVVDNDDEGVDADSDSVISLDHSIVAGNSGSDVFGASVSAAFSLLDVGSAHTASGTGNVETPDPLLAPLADNGGATPTRLPLELSPAIGAGDPAIASPPATDQRGAARIVQTIDIGAVEVDAGRVDISPVAVSVPESAGSVAVTVTRSGGTDGAVSVTVSTSDGSAVQPGDYTSVVEVVSWADGETGPKVVDVPIATDGVVEPDETFTVTLSEPTGGVGIGDATTVVSITDTPPPTTTTTTTTVPVTTVPVSTTTAPTTTTPVTNTTPVTPTTTVPAPTTTLFDGGAATLPATGGDESTGRLAWFGALLVALGAVASRLARRPSQS